MQAMTMHAWMVRYTVPGQGGWKQAMVDAPTQAIAFALVKARLFPLAHLSRIDAPSPYRALFRPMSLTPKIVGWGLP